MVDLTGSVLYEKINIGVKPGIVVNRARHARYFRLGKIVPYGRITRILDLLSDAKKREAATAKCPFESCHNTFYWKQLYKSRLNHVV